MSTTFDLKPLPGASVTISHEGGQLYRVTTTVLVDGGQLEHQFPLSLGMLSAGPGDEAALMQALMPVAANKARHVAISLLGRGVQKIAADRTIEQQLTCTITTPSFIPGKPEATECPVRFIPTATKEVSSD